MKNSAQAGGFIGMIRPAIALMLLAIGSLCFLSGLARATDDSPVGARFILSAHDGRTVTDASFRGQHRLVFFGYTHCPDICPTSLQTMATVMDQLGPLAARVQPLFITVDPERDTRAVLAPYVDFFHPRLIGLTGTPEMIAHVAHGYRAKFEKVATPGSSPGEYAIDHTAAIFHIGPDGEYVTRYSPAMTAEQITEAVKQKVLY